MKKLLLFAAFGFLASSSMAQDGLKLPALSPGATLHQEFSTSFIDISYNRPSARGRKVFGEVVPMNEIWRTGANASTKIKIGEDLIIGGMELKAGEYSLFTVPHNDDWEIIINKSLTNWGADGYNKELDAARFTVHPKMLAEPVQTFTINIGNIRLNRCTIDLAWEKTLISIPVIAKNEERIKTSIDKAINQPNIPYSSAANYYLETNQNLDLALQYADKAIELNPKAFYLYYLKARIAAKMGNRKLAMEAALKAIEYSKGSSFEAEYSRNADRLIKSLKK